MYHAHLDLADRHPPTPPPSYTPSLHSVPSYAVEPSEDEESIDTGGRPQTPIPCGEFTAKAGDVTVSLHEQEFGAGIPTYRQNAIVKGHVEISNRTAVVSVSMKLEGRQKWAIADVGRCERLLFSETHELWTKPTPLRDNSVAPNILDFYVPFPFKFVDKMYANPLVVPPSFGVKFHEDPGVSVQNEFTLITVMTVARPGSRSKQDSFTLPILLNYRPRSRPYLPIPHDLLPFFSTSKTMPEQWYQICSSIPCKDGTQKPMDCHLFIPHTQIYALRDTIPFHLHLRGSAESLRLFLGKTIKRAAASSQSDAFDPPSPSSPTIRVYIRRQVSVVVKGIRAYQGLVIGEGKLKAVERPPEWSPVSSSEEQHRTSLSEYVCDYSVDWEGEVKCNDDVHVPSFVSGDIHVKDFVVVHLRPADLRTAAHIEHRHSHVILLVTDKYRDVHPSEG